LQAVRLVFPASLIRCWDCFIKTVNKKHDGGNMKKGLCPTRRQAGLHKKLYLLFALCSLLPALLLTGCPDDPPPEVKKITIVFNTDGGSELASIDINDGATLPADYFGSGSKVPTKANNRFTGWKDGETAVTMATTFSKGTTLTAQWAPQSVTNRVTVSFSLGEGVEGIPPNPVTIDSGTALGNRFPQQNPYREGYDFLGWFNGNTEYKSTTVINSTTPDFVLTAQWEVEEEYEIEVAQSPAIHPGNHFVEIVPGGELNVKVNEVFEANGLFSNIEKGAGVLSSKWYRATSATGDGVEIEWSQTAAPALPNELSLPFTWSEPVAGVYWYWVEVNNYNKDATVQQNNTSKTQNRLKVTVTDDSTDPGTDPGTDPDEGDDE
jgi:uncharacterized repeat protein (TIGR02543 family)